MLDIKIRAGIFLYGQLHWLYRIINYWLPIEDLEEINLVPTFLKTALQDIPKEIMRVVSYE